MIIQAELKCKADRVRRQTPVPWIRSSSCQARGFGSSAAHCWLTTISSQRIKMPSGTMSDARHCLLILDAEGTDGFLVDPQGYNYARYSAFVPNARSLLTPDMAIDRSYLSPAEPWRDESGMRCSA